MASSGDDHYHPKDAVHLGLYNTMVYGGVGLLFAAVKNSLAKTNVGPWTTFTKHGGIVITFGAVGGAFEFTRAASANLREKDDYWNHGIGGLAAGAVLGLRAGGMSRVVGYAALSSVALAGYEYTGGTLKGFMDRPEMDEYERKEQLRLARRRPIEETIAEIGEGRGIRPPGYEERRRQRIKEKYGGYTCGPATVVPSTVYWSADHRRKTQALMTWTVTCTYSQQLASRYPTCCVSFSSFYNSTIVPCARCACGCGAHKSTGGRGGKSHSDGCIAGDSKRALTPGVNTPKKDGAQLLQCTNHMCPIRVHWHVKLNYKDYWRAKIAVTNFNYRMNYTQWTLVAQHPNLNNVTEVFSFQYKPLLPYGNINDTGMFYGLKLYNDLLMEAGPFGNVQSEVLMRKDDSTFTFSQGWAFPRKIYFNGDECKMPPPDSYPYLPNSTPPRSVITAASTCLMLLLLLLVA